MIYYIFLAFLNGLCISVSRVMIGRQSTDQGPFKASLYSYVVGFLFVTAVLLTSKHLSFNFLTKAPIFSLLGGFFGAIYVVINSIVFTRLGAVKTVLLVVSGQLISGVLIDYKMDNVSHFSMKFIGVFVILMGVFLSKLAGSRHDKSAIKKLEVE